MKRHHKVNHGWERPNEPISDRYQSELDTALRKAERAHRKAQQNVERAERLAAKRPTPETIAARDEARRLVLARLDELRQIELLMRTSTYATPAAVHRTGREERLEVGAYQKPKKKRIRKSPVKTRRMS